MTAPLLTLFLAAGGLPPSSTLTGDAGTLTWTVEAKGALFVIHGKSPKWTVTHLARKDLTPISTERKSAAGEKVTVEYRREGATVHLPDETIEHDEKNLWDGDTVDVRLGQVMKDGKTAEVTFEAVDPSSGKVYEFEASREKRGTFQGQSAVWVKLQLTGFYRLVGPTWHYVFGADGQLLRFEGPPGVFVAEAETAPASKKGEE